jgi:hypothetical protein
LREDEDVTPIVRRSGRGQAAVETAIIMPLTLFAILGVIQLAMMMHARYAANYAAFAAARAASVHNGNCAAAVAGALIAVAPMVGRPNNAADFITIWTTPGSSDFTLKPRPAINTNRYPPIGSLPIVTVQMTNWFVGMNHADPVWRDNKDSDFDVIDQPIMITYQVTFNYEMRIPFANAVIHESWAGANYFGPMASQGINSLMGPRERNDQPTLSAQWMPYYITARQDKRYIIPIVATATMRMMSNPYKTYWDAAKNPCSVQPESGL